ncbi:sensor histidine kinase [Cohnella mopanensis]|uniref:sensor histidine kinase n=1 Tax=Cohnella mopanensis TaxID=2911966 RepID=UPI001EF8EEBD|nr:ATP-binding protein [Cohnella mopanensis]
MRLTFILLRLAGYAAVWIGAYIQAGQWSFMDWTISVGIMAWCVGDQWKTPDSPSPTLKIGILAETALITIWALVLQDGIVLFVLISPLVRSCIHLKWQDCLWITLLEMTAILGLHRLFHSTPYLQLSLLFIAGLYAFVLGSLLREREQARRLTAISAFEQELRVKEEERMRIAGQLHDRTGQYWTAITRALDVALRLEGDKRVEFITKAREASMEGLQEMRNAVMQWNDGRQSPAEWMRFMEQSIHRFSQVTKMSISLNVSPSIDWHRLEYPAPTAETIARTVIESMTNAVRHGEAEAVNVTLESGEEEIVLTIRDNGKGIDSLSQTTSAYGIGIKTMKELVHTNGGSLKMTGAGLQGTGTIVSVTLPYRSKMKELTQ